MHIYSGTKRWESIKIKESRTWCDILRGAVPANDPNNSLFSLIKAAF